MDNTWLAEAVLEEESKKINYNPSLTGAGTLLHSLDLTKDDLENTAKVEKAITAAKKLPENEQTKKIILNLIINLIKGAPISFLIGALLGLVAYFFKISPHVVGTAGGLALGTLEGNATDYDRLIEACEKRKKKLQKTVDNSDDKKEVADAKKAIANLDNTIKMVQKDRKSSKNKASVYREDSEIKGWLVEAFLDEGKQGPDHPGSWEMKDKTDFETKKNIEDVKKNVSNLTDSNRAKRVVTANMGSLDGMKKVVDAMDRSGGTDSATDPNKVRGLDTVLRHDRKKAVGESSWLVGSFIEEDSI